MRPYIHTHTLRLFLIALPLPPHPPPPNQQVKGNKGQISWLWRKVPIPSSPSPSPTHPPAPAAAPPTPVATHEHSSLSTAAGGPLFLPLPPLANDDSLFGPGFGADRLGGVAVAKTLAAALALDGAGGGQRVVDWGCGLGGVGLAVAGGEGGVKVWGVEGRVTLVERAVEASLLLMGVWC